MSNLERLIVLIGPFRFLLIIILGLGLVSFYLSVIK